MDMAKIVTEAGGTLYHSTLALSEVHVLTQHKTLLETKKLNICSSAPKCLF